MKRIAAALAALVLLLTAGEAMAFYEAPFGVVFDTSSSRLAGNTATLNFALPADPMYKYIAIDFGATGFIPQGKVTLWVDSWPQKQEIPSAVNIADHKVELRFNKVPDNAWGLNVSIDVLNPPKAQRINTSAFSVVAGVTAAKAQSIPAMGGYLDLMLDVSANIKAGLVGKTEIVEIKVFEGGAVCSEPLRYTLKRNNKVLSTGYIPNGNLTLPLAFYFDKGKHSANYTIEVSKVAQAQIKGSLTIPVVYAVEVETPQQVSKGEERVIAGIVKDGFNRLVAGVPVSVINKGAPYMPLASASTAQDGSFSLKARFIDAAYHAVSIAGTEYATFAVSGLPIDIRLSQREIATNPVSTVIELRAFTLDKEVTQEAEFMILDPTGKTALDWTAGNPWGSWGQAGVAARKLDLGKLPPSGEYTVLARYEDIDGGETRDIYDGTGKTVFTVRNSSVAITAGKTEKGLVATGPNAITVKVTNSDGSGVSPDGKGTAIARVRFSIEGAVTEAKEFDSEVNKTGYDDTTPPNTSITVPIIVSQFGRVTVKGEVHLANGGIEPFEHVFETNGWVVEYSPLLGFVGEEIVLRATVRTADGVPVNNAKVKWSSNRNVFLPSSEVKNLNYETSYIEIDGLESNVQDGVYYAQVSLLRADDMIALQVFRPTDNTLRAYVQTMVSEGRQYELWADPPHLIATLDNQIIRVGYVGKQNKFLSTPLQIQAKGPGVDFSFVTRNETDNLLYSVSPNNEGILSFEPSLNDKSRLMPLDIPVIAPKVQHNLGMFVTENMWQDLTVKGRDEAFGGYRPVYVRVSAVGAYLDLSSQNGAFLERSGLGVSQAYTSYAAIEHSFRFMTWVAQDLPNDIVPAIKLEVSYNRRDWVTIHEAPIKPIMIMTSPDVLRVGEPQQLMVTVTDANGAALKGLRVEVWNHAATTDIHGQAVFNMRATGTHLVPITVTLDNKTANGKRITHTVYVPSVLP